MSEFLYHALGICGEHWHPNALNVTAIVLFVSIITKIVYNKVKKSNL